MMTPLAAAKAYAATQGGATAGLGAAAPSGAQDFGDLLKSVMSDAMQASKTAEVQIANQVADKAELIDVVTAISSAEASLETGMAGRGPGRSPYQELIKKPI